MSAIYIYQVIEFLEANGFYEVATRQRGSHHRYTDGKGHNVTLAYHGKGKKSTIPKATFSSIKKQMNL
jgi:predicted RNA binding protein YcfA (HicA-like mRNA interferase family)